MRPRSENNSKDLVKKPVFNKPYVPRENVIVNRPREPTKLAKESPRVANQSPKFGAGANGNNKGEYKP